jgi:hypothetical protein
MITQSGRVITWGELHVGARQTFADAGFREVSRPHAPPGRDAGRFPAGEVAGPGAAADQAAGFMGAGGRCSGTVSVPRTTPPSRAARVSSALFPTPSFARIRLT